MDKAVQERNQRNIVLTGSPRSGTTLSCYLLNKVENTVALNEPIRPRRFVHLMPDTDAVADGIERYFRVTRREIRKERTATSKHVGGALTYATYGEPNAEGMRESVLEKGEIAIDKQLQGGFFLVLKHPKMFTALLPTLIGRFPCYAIVRNPLAVLASRSSLGRDSAPPRGKPPAANAYAPEELKRGTTSAEQTASAGRDVVKGRMHRISWAFERYMVLPEDHVIRYEDIVASRGKALSRVIPAARELDEPLESKNLNELYDREKMLRIGEKLLESEGAYWHFYSRGEVEDLLSQLA